MSFPWFIAGIVAALYAGKVWPRTEIRVYAMLGAALGFAIALIGKFMVGTSFHGTLAVKSAIVFACLCMTVERNQSRKLKSPGAEIKPKLDPCMIGFEAFEIGKTLYLEERHQDALAHFDIAADGGISDPELFGLRATCLQSLDWHIDAIDDYSRAIELESKDCNLYFQRAMSKKAIGDTQGFNADINAAITLSKAPSEINRIYNEHARESGHSCVADVYESQRRFHGNGSIVYEKMMARRAYEAKQKGRRL